LPLIEYTSEIQKSDLEHIVMRIYINPFDKAEKPGIASSFITVLGGITSR